MTGDDGNVNNLFLDKDIVKPDIDGSVGNSKKSKSKITSSSSSNSDTDKSKKLKGNIGLRIIKINKPSLSLDESEETEKSGIIFLLYLVWLILNRTISDNFIDGYVLITF